MQQWPVAGNGLRAGDPQGGEVRVRRGQLGGGGREGGSVQILEMDIV